MKYKLKIILALTPILLSLLLFSCVKEKKYDRNKKLSIIKDSIETYFHCDTNYVEKELNFELKYDKDSFFDNPNKFIIKYGKFRNSETGLEEKERWHIAPFYVHLWNRRLLSDKQKNKNDEFLEIIGSFTKTILVIDTLKIPFDSRYSSEITQFSTSSYDEEMNKLKIYTGEEILLLMSKAKEVKFIVLGSEKKQVFNWNKNIEESRLIINYFNKIKNTNPNFDF